MKTLKYILIIFLFPVILSSVIASCPILDKPETDTKLCQNHVYFDSIRTLDSTTG